jgi:hypothetical protein
MSLIAESENVFYLENYNTSSDLNKMMELFPTESFFMREGS